MSFVVTFLLISLVCLLGMIIFIIATAASVMGHEEPIRQYEPTCGGCGYIVKSKQETTCEVCHADLRMVGIVQPPARAPSPSSAAWLAFRQVSGFPLALWTAAIGFLALVVIVSVGEGFWPHSCEYASKVQARAKGPNSYDSLIVSTRHNRKARGRAEIDNPSSVLHEAEIELKTKKGTSTLKADLLKGESTYTDPTGKSFNTASPPNESVISNFLEAGGIARRQAAHEAPAIALLISEPPPADAPETPADPETLSDSPMEILSINVTGGTWQQPSSLAGLAIPIWGGMWIVGVAAITWRQRGRRAALREKLLSPSTEPAFDFDIPDISGELGDEMPTPAGASPKEAGPAPADAPSSASAKADPTQIRALDFS